MKKALKLAANGVFTTGANPRVGCVIVKNHTIIAQAFHHRVGENHAEAMALAQISNEHAEGSTVYVTLEPCSHFGKNPPCAEALVKAKVKTVVVCNHDPNPLVAGKGYELLLKAGIEVISGVLAFKGSDLNGGFFHRMQTGLPWVRCKMAQSLDGRTAMANGDSYWITGKKARRDVQYWRGRSGAIVTGIETVLTDDCRLTVRTDSLAKKYRKLEHDFEQKQPLRVVIDSHLRIPLAARVLQNPSEVIVVCAHADQEKIKRLTDQGCSVKVLPNPAGRVDLAQVIEYLGSLQINEVLLESGATLAGAMLKAGLLNELIIYTAPVIMGSSARGMFEIDIEEMANRLHIEPFSYQQFGQDWRLRALINN